MFRKMIVRDPLLLLASLIAILWGWSCISLLYGPEPTYRIRDNRANDRAGVDIPSGGGTATLDLNTKSLWKENDCVIRRTILSKGITTSATVTDEGVLTITASAQQSDFRSITTVKVESRTENCKDRKFDGRKETSWIAVNFN